MQQSLLWARCREAAAAEHCLHVFQPEQWLLAADTAHQVVQYITSIFAIAVWACTTLCARTANWLIGKQCLS